MLAPLIGNVVIHTKGRYSLRAILILLSVIFCSIVPAQNICRPIGYLKAEIKYFDKNNNSHIILFETDKTVTHKHSFLNLSGQAIVGSTFAVGFSILPLTAAWANAWGSDGTPASQTALGILTVSSYLFGSAVGVHLVAKSENPELSLWKTFGYSAIGGGVGVVLVAIFASQYETIPGAGDVIVALCPIIGSMVYASFISDWPQEYQEVSFAKTSILHKDIIDQTKLFNIELLRIKL
jgi:hypothetical protein